MRFPLDPLDPLDPLEGVVFRLGIDIRVRARVGVLR